MEFIVWALCVAAGLSVGWELWGRELGFAKTERDYWHREAMRAQAFADRLLETDRG